MRNICLVSGPALGHVGRLYQAARSIRAYGEVNMHFLLPARCVFAERVLSREFSYSLLADDGEDPLESAGHFAIAVEAHFRDNNYDLIMLDANPMRWMALIKFPPVQRVFITNAFLTAMHAADTVQSRFFGERGIQLNRLRERRGIAPLTCAYDLYEADKVLLADPLSLVNHLGTKPSNYVACGPCSWEFDGALPDELCSLDRLLLLSMGSTGPNAFCSTKLKMICDVTGSRSSVYAGSRADSPDIYGFVDFAYHWLSLKQLIPKCSAVISQGGAGSSYQALLMGCPLLIIGGHQNHLILADLLQEMGLAFRLDAPGTTDVLNEKNFAQLLENVARFAGEERNQDGALKISEEVHQMLR